MKALAEHEIPVFRHNKGKHFVVWQQVHEHMDGQPAAV